MRGRGAVGSRADVERSVRVETEEAHPDGRQRLITTSLRLFAEKGFDGVTVRDIAKASSVSVGLINHHFGSKEGLREAVDEYFIAQFEEALTAPPEADAPSRARSMDDWVDDWITRHAGESAALFGYFRRALLDDSEWGARLFARFYAIAQSTVTRMDARGLIRPDVDRLWLPFLMVFLELGTTLLDPHIKRIMGRSGFDKDLWRRRHRAYRDLMWRGYGPSGRRRAEDPES